MNYLRQYALDAAQAHKLLEAMERWLSAPSRDKGNLSHDALAVASEWIAARRGADKSNATN